MTAPQCWTVPADYEGITLHHPRCPHRIADAEPRIRYYGCDKCGTILTMTTREAIAAHAATHREG